MDFNAIEAFFAAFLAEGPQLVKDVATGEGGLQKIVKVLGDAAQGLTIFHSAIASHPAVQNADAPAPEPPAAA